MNFTDYATSYAEITQNLTAATTLGLPVNRQRAQDRRVLRARRLPPRPEQRHRPADRLRAGASNPSCCGRPRTSGVKYLHGNMSFASHQPSCFNCGIVHPLEPSVTVVPDWPTNIAYFTHHAGRGDRTSTTRSTGPNGKFPYWPTNLTYAQIIDYETDSALSHIATGSIYTHTFHIGNLRDYGGGRTLITDWLDAVLRQVQRLLQGAAAQPRLAGPGRVHREPQRALRRARARAWTRSTTAAHQHRHGHLAGRRHGAPSAARPTAGFTTYGSEVSAADHADRQRAPVTFTAEPAAVKIALVSEGTYPYAMGGVSVWCDQLIRGLPDYRWEMVALTVDGSERPVWAPPGQPRRRCIRSRCGAPGAPGAARRAAAARGSVRLRLRGVPHRPAHARWTPGSDRAAVSRSRFAARPARPVRVRRRRRRPRRALTSNEALTQMMDAWHEHLRDDATLDARRRRSRRPG